MKSKQKAENNRNTVGESREAVTIRADEPLPIKLRFDHSRRIVRLGQNDGLGLIMDLQDDGLLNNSFSGRM